MVDSEDSVQESYRFQRVFVCPEHTSRSTFILCRPFVAMDGTFLKTRWGMTLLLAVGIYGNGETVILEWTVVESENTSS